MVLCFLYAHAWFPSADLTELWSEFLFCALPPEDAFWGFRCYAPALPTSLICRYLFFFSGNILLKLPPTNQRKDINFPLCPFWTSLTLFFQLEEEERNGKNYSVSPHKMEKFSALASLVTREGFSTLFFFKKEACLSSNKHHPLLGSAQDLHPLGPLMCYPEALSIVSDRSYFRN